MRWSTQRPVSNGIQLQAEIWKQSAATGMLNGLALDYLSTIFPVLGLDITFLIACLCVARSVRALGAVGLLGTLATGRLGQRFFAHW